MKQERGKKQSDKHLSHAVPRNIGRTVPGGDGITTIPPIDYASSVISNNIQNGDGIEVTLDGSDEYTQQLERRPGESVKQHSHRLKAVRHLIGTKIGPKKTS